MYIVYKKAVKGWNKHSEHKTLHEADKAAVALTNETDPDTEPNQSMGLTRGFFGRHSSGKWQAMIEIT